MIYWSDYVISETYFQNENLITLYISCLKHFNDSCFSGVKDEDLYLTPGQPGPTVFISSSALSSNPPGPHLVPQKHCPHQGCEVIAHTFPRQDRPSLLFQPHCVRAKSLLSCRLFATLWTIAHQIPPARILEWVAIPDPGASSQLRDRTVSFMSPVLEDRFFTTSTTWETLSPH